MIMTIKEIIFEIENSNKPITTILSKGTSSKLIAVGLAKGVIMKKHKAPGHTRMIVLKGQIEYKTQHTAFKLSAFDEHQIPLEEIHSVKGNEDSVFLLSVNN